MWPLLVVFRDPQFGDFAHLLDRLEQLGVQCLLAVGAIESLDKGILVRLARLDVEQLNLLSFAPVLKSVGGKFGTVVHPQSSGICLAS